MSIEIFHTSNLVGVISASKIALLNPGWVKGQQVRVIPWMIGVRKYLKANEIFLDVMIGSPGTELSPAKWYDCISFPFSADWVEHPLSNSARNSKSKFLSFDSTKVPFLHLLPAISISSIFTKNQSAISFLPERSLSSSLKGQYKDLLWPRKGHLGSNDGQKLSETYWNRTPFLNLIITPLMHFKSKHFGSTTHLFSTVLQHELSIQLTDFSFAFIGDQRTVLMNVGLRWSDARTSI